MRPATLSHCIMQMTLLRRLRHENVIAVVDIMAPPAAQVGTANRMPGLEGSGVVLAGNVRQRCMR